MHAVYLTVIKNTLSCHVRIQLGLKCVYMSNNDEKVT